MISARILYIHSILFILIQILALPSVMVRVVSFGIGLSLLINTYMSNREKKIAPMKKEEPISIYATTEEIRNSQSRSSSIERHSLTTFQ